MRGSRCSARHPSVPALDMAIFGITAGDANRIRASTISTMSLTVSLRAGGIRSRIHARISLSP